MGRKYFANVMFVVTLFAVTSGQMLSLQVTSVPGILFGSQYAAAANSA